VTDVLIGLPAIAILALLLGYGWSAVLHQVPPGGPLGYVFRAWALSIASLSLVWAWIYPVGLSATAGIVAVLVLAIAGHLLAIYRHAYPDYKEILSSLFGLTTPALVTAIGIVPAVATFSRLTAGMRIGPDAAGWAVSTSVISQENTRQMIQSGLLSQVGKHALPVAQTPDPSFAFQVANAFMESADRWALPGAAGSIIRLIGPSHLWSLITLLTAFTLLTTCTGIWTSVMEGTNSRWAAVFGVVLLGLSSTVLDNWHEGGLGEIFVMPFCLLMALVLMGQGVRSRLSMGMATAIANGGTTGCQLVSGRLQVL
jgi:hypothetical protein